MSSRKEARWTSVSGTRAGIFPLSLSMLALLDLASSLAGGLVEIVPNGPSLSVPDDMSYSAVSVHTVVCP
jgi:hypothetical protein